MTDTQTNLDTVYSIAASPTFASDGVCFAGRTSGLYRSDDGGRTWRNMFEVLNLDAPLAATAVALSPDFASDREVFAGVSGGILRSPDGGQTWYFAVLPAPPPVITALAVSPNYVEDGTLFAGTAQDGMYCSTDRGVRWTAWNFGLLDLGVLSVSISPDFASDETVFVGTETGLFRSTNGGRAWREVGLSPDVAPVISLAISPRFAGGGALWAGTESHGLFVSDDRGQSWRPVGEGAFTGAINGIALSPDYPSRPHVLALLDRALLVSRDGGLSWTNWGASTLDDALICLAAPLGIDPSAPLLVGTAGSGVIRL